MEIEIDIAIPNILMQPSSPPSLPQTLQVGTSQTDVVWTTQDELMFIRSLFLRGKLKNLRNYVRVAHERRWWGTGMAVNPMIVIPEARDLLRELERQQGTSPV